MTESKLELQPRYARRQYYLRILFALGVVILGLMFIASMWWGTLNDTPTLKIPMPTMPKQNARDYFIKASDEIVNDMQLAYIETAIRTHSKEGHIYTLAEKAAVIRQNVAAVQTLHEGFAFPYHELPVRDLDNTLMNLDHHYIKYRSLARLLWAKGRVEAEQGDYDAAINSDMDAIQMGQMMPHGAPLIGSLVGIAVEAIGGKNAGGYIVHLNARQARAAAKRMEQIIALHIPWADMLQEEKWTQQVSLVKLFRDPKWHEEMAQMASPADDEDSDKRNRMEKLRDTVRLYLVNKHEVMYNYTHYMDQLIANAGLPYAAHPADPPVPSDPVCQVVAIGGNMGRDKAVEMDARNAQLCLSLALRAYRLEHGEYPLNLQSLVPAYLNRLPDDPYALQGSYGYVRDKVGYTLSSGGVPATH
jgi:hypothetical protein